jgi:probable rRNA maturation factor
MDGDGPEPVFVTIGAPGWWAALEDAPALCRQAVQAALQRAAPWLGVAEVGVLLGDDDAIRQLNARHRDQDRATNVLAFPLLDLDEGRPRPGSGLEADLGSTPGPILLGDVALALETVCAEAEQAGRPVGDHLCHLVVHGSLHLLGFDHGDDDQARVMEDLERTVMADLQRPDPYADPAAVSCGGQHAQEAV